VALNVRSDLVSLPWSDDLQEQHLIQCFVRHSAPRLVDYLDSPFWQRTVLQAVVHEPAFKHAIAAIGSLHDKLLTDSADLDLTHSRRTGFAPEQCKKPIRHPIQPANEDKAPVLYLTLTTCVLSTCSKRSRATVSKSPATLHKVTACYSNMRRIRRASGGASSICSGARPAISVDGGGCRRSWRD